MKGKNCPNFHGEALEDHDGGQPPSISQKPIPAKGTPILRQVAVAPQTCVREVGAEMGEKRMHSELKPEHAFHWWRRWTDSHYPFPWSIPSCIPVKLMHLGWDSALLHWLEDVAPNHRCVTIQLLSFSHTLFSSTADTCSSSWESSAHFFLCLECLSPLPSP